MDIERFQRENAKTREYVAGVSKKPSLRDVAKQAQVSVGTVSNVLNRPTNVSEQTRLRVRNAIDMLGFIPDGSMKSKNTESNVIGVILPMSNNPFYEELTLGIEDAIAKAGLCVLVGYSREDSAVELKLLTSMIDAGFKGVIVTPVGPKNQIFERFIDKNVRVGFISQTDEQPEQCSVSIDQVRGGYIGIEFLHRLGHKKILWVSGPDRHHQSSRRFLGITQAAREFDVDLSTIKAQSLDFISGEQIGPAIIAAGPLPDAIFAGNDALGMGIINYLTSVGVDVPGTVSVLGYDNTAYAESGLIPLSTVSQTPYHLGATMGAQVVAELAAGIDHVHQHVVFQPQIIERASTARRI
jgi:LacI family transcriptional regulator